MSDREVVYGRNPVRELIRAGRRRVHAVMALASLREEPWLGGVDVKTASRDALGRLAGTADHQGVVALADPYPYATLRDVLAGTGPVVVLDGAQDPRNLGAIARVADGAGAAGMVIGARGSVGVTAVACKASAGAVEHLAIHRGEVLAALHEARGAGRRAAGADPEAGHDHLAADLPPDAVLVLGSEGAGLRPRVRAACDVLVRIPLAGEIASLNIAVAAGILLFALKGRVHRPPNATHSPQIA